MLSPMPRTPSPPSSTGKFILFKLVQRVPLSCWIPRGERTRLTVFTQISTASTALTPLCGQKPHPGHLGGTSSLHNTSLQCLACGSCARNAAIPSIPQHFGSTFIEPSSPSNYPPRSPFPPGSQFVTQHFNLSNLRFPVLSFLLPAGSCPHPTVILPLALS